MLPRGSIFFPLRLDPIRIENNLKGNEKIENVKIKLRKYFSFFNLPNFESVNLSVLQYLIKCILI